MNTDALDRARRTFMTDGSVLFGPTQTPLTREDWTRLDECSWPERVPHERILIGDANEQNHVLVARFMTDVDQPRLVNRDAAEVILGIIGSPRMMNFYRGLLNQERVTIRRCQVNLYGPGSFVGRHLDTDSNPDYLSPVVLQFRDDYEGGEYVVHAETGVMRYNLGSNNMLVSRCDIPHEVTPVTRGSRKSLVFFLAAHGRANRRWTEQQAAAV
jgi:hypothetical protein